MLKEQVPVHKIEEAESAAQDSVVAKFSHILKLKKNKSLLLVAAAPRN